MILRNFRTSLRFFLILSALIGVSEVFLRLPLFPAISFRLEDKRLHCLSQGTIPWIQLCPNSDKNLYLPQKERGYRIRTNEYGERISYEPGKEPKLPQGELWILGDSVAMGYLVQDEETISWKLAERNPNLRIRNLGVDSGGTLGILNILRTNISSFGLPKASYWIYHISDLEDSFREERMLNSGKNRFSIRLSYYLSRYSALFNALKILSENLKPEWAENRIESVPESASPILTPNHPHTTALLSLFSFCKENGFPLVLVLVPEPNREYLPVFHSQLLEELKSLADQNGIPVLDLREDLASFWKSTSTPLFLPKDGHPNPTMYTRIAEAIEKEGPKR
ncbi:hypothetical protein EHO60_16620 [Leptospira fletcheri]|uniref:SGNH/GDSL hydrolase family protein n=1 Tax=Leptospira fletcheri TaxID=2484981 RepID=A0A4R9G4Z4_9LEPT|nr:hypothetical protein [Leptospira fletcheri]TGK06215.1 hypothetical protein EHO60_16620 [Leptospira fletcheri]